MLINKQQAAINVQKTQRTDLDPANAAASTLFSGTLQNAQGTAQQSATTTAQKATLAAASNVDAAFAKTRVQLQATQAATETPKTTTATETPKTATATDAPSQAMRDFKEYMSKTPEQRYREAILQEMGLTEESLKELPPEKQLAIAKEIADRMQDKIELKVAQKTQDPKADELKAKLAASL